MKEVFTSSKVLYGLVNIKPHHLHQSQQRSHQLRPTCLLTIRTVCFTPPSTSVSAYSSYCLSQRQLIGVTVRTGTNLSNFVVIAFSRSTKSVVIYVRLFNVFSE